MRLYAGLLLLGSLPAWPQWTPVNGPIGSSIDALFQKDSVLYAGTHAGIYRSRDAGMSWDRTTAGFSSQEFAASGPYILARSTSHVIRSSNQGDTWDTVHSGLVTSSVIALAAFGGRVFLGTEHGTYRSSDHGSSWTPSHEGMGGDVVVSEFVAAGPWLLAFKDTALYRTADTGRTWVRTGADLPGNSGITWHSFARTREHLFAKSQGVFRSRDSGATWTPVPGSPPDSNIYRIFDDGQDLFAGSETGLYRSSDEGVTFEKVNGYFNPTFMPNVAARRGAELFLATSQGVFRSVDRGATWQSRNRGIGVTPAYDFLSVGKDLFVAAGEYELHRTSDRGENWTRIRIPAGMPISLAAAGDTIFVGTQYVGGVLASIDRGTTWRPFDLGLEPGANIVRELEAGGGNLYAIINSNAGTHVYSTRSDRGRWGRCASGPTWASDLLLHGDTLYAASDSGLAFSTDHCNTWSPAPARPGGKGVGKVAALGRFLVTSGPDGLYRSDSGTDWIRVDTVPGTKAGSDSWFSLVSTSAGIFAGTRLGLIRFSGDSGATWISLSEGLGPFPSPIRSFVEHEGEIYAGMFGIFKRPSAGMGLGTRRREGPYRPATRSRLRSALQALRELGADLLGRSAPPGASQSP